MFIDKSKKILYNINVRRADSTCRAKLFQRRDRIGIAVDEDGEHRNIRRMSHGRQVVNERLKPESDFGTEAFRYAVKNQLN